MTDPHATRQLAETLEADGALYATMEAASACAWLLLAPELPGGEVYVAELVVDGHHRGYRVVPARRWPDQAWQEMAQRVLSRGEPQRVQVQCVVRLVLRKPVVSPPEVARHVFIVGHMQPHPVSPPGVQ